MHVYVTYGSALDDTGKPEEAIKVYEQGTKQFPTFYLLYFNEGLTQMRLKNYDDALKNYILSLKNNGLHPSSNFYIGALLQDNNRIPALLAYATFIATEPQTERSKKAFDAIQKISYGNITKNGNNTTITIPSDILGDKKKKITENHFSSVELMFSLLAGTSDSKGLDSVAKTPAEKFDFRLQMLINNLSLTKKDNKGFYWEHYVPFFIEMKEKNYTHTLSNLIYLSDDADAKAWLDLNPDKVKEFYDWLKVYKWDR